MKEKQSEKKSKKEKIPKRKKRGVQDITHKDMMKKADVFADVFNESLFGGENIVNAETLSDCDTSSTYAAEDSVLRGQMRDVAKYMTDSGVRLAMLGVENQSKQDEDMVFRVFSYDAASYLLQVKERIFALKHKMKRMPVYPVITVVLNTSEHPWEAPKSLKERLGRGIPEEMRMCLNDYKIYVIDVVSLTQEEIERYKSDFAHFAGYVQAYHRDEEYVPLDRPLDHPEETLRAIAAVTGSTDMWDEFNLLREEERKGGTFKMCRVMDRVEKRGEQRGQTNALKVVATYQRTGSVPETAKECSTTEESVNAILAEFAQFLS